MPPKGRSKSKNTTSTSASPVPGDSSSENEDATGGQAGAANLSSHSGPAQAPLAQRTDDNGGSNAPQASGGSAASAEQQPVQPSITADRHVSFSLQQSAENVANVSAGATIPTLRLDPKNTEAVRPSGALNLIAEQMQTAHTQAYVEQQRHMLQQIQESQAAHLSQQQVAQQHLYLRIED
jgi:hypothetical protein